MKTARLYLDVDYDESVTDAEGVANALDTLLETAMSTPEILDEYGNPDVGAFYVTPTDVGTWKPTRGYPGYLWLDVPREDGGPGLPINGCTFHVNAIEVQGGTRQAQVAVYDGCQDMLDALYAMGEPDEPYATIDINGKPHVMLLTPFCR
jgi:hypothetical protein